MTEPGLRGRRVLLLGAETEVGRAVADALASAGADVAVVAATSDAEAAFAVQRLARRLSAVAQAIDATNEMAVRVMVRQVAKQLGGLDAVVFCANLGPLTRTALDLAVVYGAREMARHGGGRFVALGTRPEVVSPDLPAAVELEVVTAKGKTLAEVARDVLAAIAGQPRNG